ncbi:hypothetical protein C1645_837142 [Glomus cerebriforme]|uniref:Uncharacterized protein n=1 Tax=Glomus cerebriforme TaxID=658196 RepID=A0A397S964_9GLOM|nr:hypothetical protein C1645_837142 [Glomus cerebriforme]
MFHSVCLECPTIKAKKRNNVFQIKASQDIKPSNHNSDMIEVPIIKEQNNLISDSDIKQQTQDITNLQDVYSIKDISSEKALLENREIDVFLDGEYKKKIKSSTSSHPISNNPILSEQNAKIKVPKLDIQSLI